MRQKSGTPVVKNFREIMPSFHLDMGQAVDQLNVRCPLSHGESELQALRIRDHVVGTIGHQNQAGFEAQQFLVREVELR